MELTPKQTPPPLSGKSVNQVSEGRGKRLKRGLVEREMSTYRYLERSKS